MWINKEIQKSIRDLQCYTWDITGINPPPFKDINLVISDIPYGNMVNWQGSEKNHVQQMLANIYPILDCKNAVVAIISDKSQKVRHNWFEKVEESRHGKRQITLLKPYIR